MKKVYLSLLTCMIFIPFFSQAEVRINGFASIYGGKTLDNDESIYGYSDDIDWQNGSLFAVQLSSDLSEGLSATAQILARGNNDFNAEFEWAYLTYSISDNAQISTGKMRIPFYRYSDFLDVGYAYRWAKPPQSVYNLNFSTYEGVSYLYTSYLSEWDSSLQLIYGAVDTEFSAITDSDKGQLKDTFGVNWSLSNDWFTARLAYLVTETTIDLSGSAELSALIGGLQAYGLTGQSNNIEVMEDDSYFAAVGIGINYENILLDAEYTEFEIDNSIFAKQQQYYISLGYQFDSVTLSLTYENNDDENSRDQFNQVPRAITGPNGIEIPVVVPNSEPAIYLQDLTNSALASQRASSDTYSFAFKYDFHTSATFKAQLTKLEDDITGVNTGLLIFGVDLVF
ncbi:hypothetical protein C1E24_00045 [Pseudoalteromonas phenolica]|uniref:Uncharacterized protein n=1 Tax=Pseudoalteromonas phenolica TaxID=161398 RepID=A0A5R9Q7I0_9GAMM|nr:porin [Pseudoalteromonas phenolica]TLX48935.1 hypothetical protein C1E24_00045 [Pseudoalteromonas phenolica]